MKYLVATVLVAFTLSLMARADDKPAKLGKVRYKELKAALDAQLEELDRDQDKRLDHGEVHRAMRALRKTLDGMPEETEFDTDNDGKVERKELKAKVDTDGDHRIDHGEARQELLNFKQQYPQAWAQVLERVDKIRRHPGKDHEDRKERREERRAKKDK